MASASANASCQWLSRNTIDITCNGGTKTTNICGTRSGNSICSGKMVCSEGFALSGVTYDPGMYSLTCLTPSGFCEKVSLNDCVSDQHVSTYEKEGISGGILNRIQEGIR